MATYSVGSHTALQWFQRLFAGIIWDHYLPVLLKGLQPLDIVCNNTNHIITLHTLVSLMDQLKRIVHLTGI